MKKMKTVSIEYFLFLVEAQMPYEGHVEGVGYISYRKSWGIPPFKSFDYNMIDNTFLSVGYILEITLDENSSKSIEDIVSSVDKSHSNQYKNRSHIIKRTSSLEDAWKWTQDHFEARGEYELSFGTQIAGGIKKAAYAEINAHSHVMQNLYFSYRDGIEEPIYQSQLDIDKPQVITKSIGAAYYAGVELSSRTETNGITTYTFSIGAFCVGGEVSWDENGIDDWFFGVDLTAKVAVFVGLMFNFKIGFSKND